MQSNDKKISINALYLYIRMFFSLLVGLYTSRVILANLGVENFGIYNLVGGVVSMMAFLNGSMSSATSRYLTYYLGKNNFHELSKCFTSALQIHIGLGLVLLLLGETFGLWFVNTQLVVPTEKIISLNYVFQFSLLSSIIAICKVPYTANLIANEKMNAYALFEIIYVLLKLLVAILIPLFPEKLINYAFSLFCCDIVIFCVYFAYCKRFYQYCKLARKFYKDICLSLMGFSVLDLFGNGTYTAKQIGTNVLINRFFGVALNATSGVATQVGGVVSSFVMNVQNAFRPQIVKSYAQNDFAKLQHLLRLESKVSLYFAACFFTPLFINLDFIMHLWLKEVPPLCLEFCSFLLITNLLSVINNILLATIHATGKIKLLSCFSGILNLLCLLFVYILFKLQLGPETAYIVFAVCVFLQILSNIVIVKYQLPDINMWQFVKVTFSTSLLVLSSFAITSAFAMSIYDRWLELLFTVLFNAFCLMLIVGVCEPEVRRMVLKKWNK